MVMVRFASTRYADVCIALERLSLSVVHSFGLYGNTCVYKPHDVPFSYLTLLIKSLGDVWVIDTDHDERVDATEFGRALSHYWYYRLSRHCIFLR